MGPLCTGDQVAEHPASAGVDSGPELIALWWQVGEAWSPTAPPVGPPWPLRHPCSGAGVCPPPLTSGLVCPPLVEVQVQMVLGLSRSGPVSRTALSLGGGHCPGRAASLPGVRGGWGFWEGEQGLRRRIAHVFQALNRPLVCYI